MELDTQGKMISVFRVGLKHKQNKTHRVSHWMDRKKLRQDADFPALKQGFVVLFLARTCFLFLLERKEGVKYVG